MNKFMRTVITLIINCLLCPENAFEMMPGILTYSNVELTVALPWFQKVWLLPPRLCNLATPLLNGPPSGIKSLTTAAAVPAMRFRTRPLFGADGASDLRHVLSTVVKSIALA